MLGPHSCYCASIYCQKASVYRQRCPSLTGVTASRQMGCADGCAATTDSGSATTACREMSKSDCSELTAVTITASGGDVPV